MVLPSDPGRRCFVVRGIVSANTACREDGPVRGVGLRAECRRVQTLTGVVSHQYIVSLSSKYIYMYIS